MNSFARCHCGECQRLDKLPVRRHGIPHAWQPNMLSTYPAQHCPALPEPTPQPSLDGLPLFGGSLEPCLL